MDFAYHVPHAFFILAILFSIPYFIGSIPFGLILTKTFLKEDVRNVGSGNIGATNVLRVGGKKLALLTLMLDVIKGYAACFSTIPLSLLILRAPKPGFFDSPDFHPAALTIGFLAIIGHCFPVWLKFKGGKGVATTFGVFLAAVPWAGFVALCTWGIVAGFFRYSSLSALCAVAITPLATFLIYGSAPALITILIAALVIWRHKDNIKRLMAGDEPKIFENKDAKPANTE